MSKKIFSRSHQQVKGFTLIELLVVIFIIGVLASLILSNILGARQRAEDTKRKNDLKQMQTALRLYYNDHQNYPAADVLDPGEKFEVNNTVYMGALPDEFTYTVSTDGEEFRLRVALENASDQDIALSQAKCAEEGEFVDLGYDDNDYVVCEY